MNDAIRARIATAATAAALVLALAAAVGGCGGSSSAPTPQAQRADVARAGQVVLTVWDEQVRGGQEAQITQLNRRFEQRYPNVRIRRVARKTADLNASLKLAVSRSDAPDVVQANQGRQVMGELVRDGLLRPLDGYARAYGWTRRWPGVLLDLARFTPDGGEFGAGRLYGLWKRGGVAGFFSRRDQVPAPPRSLADFEGDLRAAHARGEVPIAFGDLDGWPGIHELQTLQAQFVPREEVRRFVFGRPGATFDTPGTRVAAATLQRWAQEGLLQRGFTSLGYEPAWRQFARGKGRYLIAGSWLTADLARLAPGRIGFMLMPPREAGGAPAALGGASVPFAITARSRHPEVAAAYLDWITSRQAAQVMARTGNLPAVPGAQDVAAPDRLTSDVRAA